MFHGRVNSKPERDETTDFSFYCFPSCHTQSKIFSEWLEIKWGRENSMSDRHYPALQWCIFHRNYSEKCRISKSKYKKSSELPKIKYPNTEYLGVREKTRGGTDTTKRVRKRRRGKQIQVRIARAQVERITIGALCIESHIVFEHECLSLRIP